MQLLFGEQLAIRCLFHDLRNKWCQEFRFATDDEDEAEKKSHFHRISAKLHEDCFGCV